MSIKEILEKYLKDNKYDGLAGERCGCQIGDLMPCYNPSPNCTPGYKRPCSDCLLIACETRLEVGWCMQEEKK